MDAALENLMNAIRRSMSPTNTLLQSLSSASLFLECLFANINFCAPDNALAGLEKLEAVLCKNFDEMMTESNSVAATYHTLVQRNAAYERLIKELTASGNSNTVSNKVQLLQNAKAQIEQDMVQLEDVQCLVWKGTQKTHFFRN